MGRPCQAESSIQDVFNAMIQQRVQAEVGLVVGMPAVGSRDLLLCIAKTPAQDGAEAAQVTAAGKAGGKGKAGGTQVSIAIDEEWVAAHAEQLQRMLPGGLRVMGAYIFAPESGYQSASNQLSNLLNSILPAAPAGGRPDGSDALLLHVDPDTRRTALRSCAAGAASPSSLKPCELKYGAALPSLVCLTCSLQVDASLQLAAGSQQALHEHAAALVEAQCGRIQSAHAVMSGRLLQESSALADVLPASAAPGPAGAAAHHVQLLLQPCFQCSPSVLPALSRQAQQQQVGGSCWLYGSITGVAVAHSRQPAARAAQDLKADLAASLRTRLDLLMDEAEQLEQQQQQQQAQQEQQAQQQQQAQAPPARHLGHPLLAAAGAKLCMSALPRRVLLPWLGHLQLADHLLTGELPADSAERAGDMLGLQLDGSAQVLEAEAAPAAQPQQLGFWDPTLVDGAAAGGRRAAAGQPAASSSACSAGALAGAGAAVVLAAAVSYLAVYS